MPSAKVNLDKVYYSDDPDKQRKGRKLLYVNYRKRYRRTNPMSRGDRAVVAPRVCTRKCLAITGGRHCRRRSCFDYRYCWQHLASEKHLLIAPSRRLASFGIPGNPLGLYAVADSKDRVPVKKPQEIVFKKGEMIDMYGGEEIDPDERYPDPKNRETATYAVTAADGTVYDALAAAGAVSYSNEVVDVRDLMERHKTKAGFVRAYKAAEKKEYGPHGHANIGVANSGGGMIKFKATRPVSHGQELLWTYGSEYWESDGMKYYLTGSSWSGAVQGKRRAH